MDFIDFQMRAWQVDGSSIQVMVHSSPVGSMRQPVTVPCDFHQLNYLRVIADKQWLGQPGTYQRVIDIGKQLSQLIFPAKAYTLLVRSLEKIGDEDGLRLRLCLDKFLIDLPWEFLYRPDVSTHKPLTGFLTLDPRISLVREAPIIFQRLKPSRRQQHLLFAGALSPSDMDCEGDRFEVKKEHEEISKALEDVKEFLSTKFIPASDNRIEEELEEPTALFHYSGHTDVTEDGQGYLVKEWNPRLHWHPKESPQRLFSEWLGILLRRAGTKLAVFSACNSGRWAFMEPLIRAGIPALIGTQGTVSTDSSIAFSQKLYSSLAIGLSLDEAVTWTRLHLQNEILSGKSATGQESCEWGSFMVYMPAIDARLLPKPHQQDIIKLQQDARRARQQTTIYFYQNIKSIQGGEVKGIVANQIDGYVETAHNQDSNSKESTMPRKYLDFNLELRDLDEMTDTFKVVVSSSIVGETREAVTVPYQYKELKSKLRSLEDKSIADTPDSLIKLGQGLAERLLPVGEIRKLFQDALNQAEATSGVRLRLRINNTKLAQLPWEFSYLQMDEQEPGYFIALNPRISIVRHEAQAKRYPSPQGTHPSKLRLVVAMVPEVKGYDELELDRERGVIEEALKKFQVDGVSLEWQPLINPSPTDLQKALQPKADLFHFAGHGEFKENADVNPETRELEGRGYLLLLEDKNPEHPARLADKELADYLIAGGVRVAVLGACQSGRRDGVSPWAGVAAALVKQDIPVVVAMQYKVRDPHAIAFSEMFYASLVSGLSVDEAVSAGRLAMRGKDEQNVEWGVPVLYMRSEDGIIFPKLTERKSKVGDRIRLAIQQIADTIKEGGKVVGFNAKELKAGDYKVGQKANLVEGEMIGANLDSL